MPFPVNGPTTEAAVRELGRVPAGEDTARVQRIVSAVNGFVLSLPAASVAEDAPDWGGVEVAPLVEGATMLAASLYRRKNSLDGVAAISGDGVAYVRREDPHVAMLLGLGGWASPMVG